MIRIEERVEDTVVDDSFYNVIMYNDKETPFPYVIDVLNQIFEYEIDEAIQLTMYIHMNGLSVVATLPMKEAYEKVDAVDAMNARFGFLLQTNVERA